MLKAAGARKGQEVEIGEETLEWQYRHPRRPRSTRRTSVTSRSHRRPWSTSASTTCTSPSSPTRRTSTSEAPAGDRLAMATLAFAELDATVELEAHRYTVDALEAAGYDDPIFLIGADELADFPTWKEPERVLELARLGVATRPGYAPATASPRIQIFELEPHPVSSSEIRRRAQSRRAARRPRRTCRRRYIAEHGLYRPQLTSGFRGYTDML